MPLFNDVARPDLLPFALRYCIYGTELAQRQALLGQISTLAAKNGYTKVRRIEVNAHYVWEQLLNICSHQNLFSDKEWLDIRLETPPVSTAATACLNQIFTQPPTDFLLSVTLDKLAAKLQQQPWFQAIKQHGVVCAIKRLRPQQWTEWVNYQFDSRGYPKCPATRALFSQCYQGNELAALNCLRKIELQAGAETPNTALIEAQLSQDAQFNLHELTQACLAQQATQVVAIYKQQLEQGIALSLLLWALQQEIQRCQALRQAQRNNTLNDTFAQLNIWQSRKAGYLKKLAVFSDRALATFNHQLLQADYLIKGVAAGCPRTLLLKLFLYYTNPSVFNLQEEPSLC